MGPGSSLLRKCAARPGCIGLSTSWPHIDALIRTAGLVGPDRHEVVLAGDCSQLARLAADSNELPNTTIRRSVGTLGTRFDLMDGDRSLGYIEAAPAGASLQRSSASTTWADIGNLFPAEGVDFATVMGPLIGAAAQWLQLGGVERLIDYYAPDVHQPQYLKTLLTLGFKELTVNQRGWQL